MTRHERRVATLAILATGIAAAAGVAVSRKRTRETLGRGLPFAAPERSRSGVIDGIRMRWEQHGPDSRDADTVVVFIHGLPTNPRLWRYVIPRVVSDDTCCLAWEQVGFGQSLRQGFGRDLSIGAQADRLRQWLFWLGVTRAVFVGHDYGGAVLQQLAVEDPGLFEGLVLADSVAFDNWPVAPVRVARSVRPLLAILPPLALKPLLAKALIHLGHTDAAIAAESIELFSLPYDTPWGPSAFAHQLRFFDNQQTRAIGRALHPIGCPTEIVWGEDDPLGLDSAHALARRLGARLRVLRGARHFTVEDQPEAVATSIRSVLADLDIERADRIEQVGASEGGPEPAPGWAPAQDPLAASAFTAAT